MKGSDYIVDFLIKKGITDVFGYPGGMVTHFMDSLGKKKERINTHITYHEQAAAFSACGYAQATGKVGVAFATSGPGATNLLTGIGHAFFDSVPTIFITGQVNTFESKGNDPIRQKGFQETDIVSMAKPVTKAAIYVESADKLQESLEMAYKIALDHRRGPVLIDIPMNVFRSEIDIIDAASESEEESCGTETKRFSEVLIQELSKAQRPCLLLGNGIKICNQVENIRGILRSCPMPVVSSMLAVDIIPEGQGLEGIYYGFVGAYGNRSANFIVAKSDLIICLGSRLDIRQVGAQRERFAPDATIIRVDIDKDELMNKIRDDEIQFCMELSEAIPVIRSIVAQEFEYASWLDVCQKIKKQVKYIDEKYPNRVVNEISRIVPDDYCVTADVGQNMVWTAQSFKFKPSQRVFMSGGMGAMGFALPSALGVYEATGKPVICISGDGGIQMNIQELQYLVRDRIPVKIFVLNNKSLGMIRHFQEMYFESHYFYTVSDQGYDTPDFVKVARAYGLKADYIEKIEDIKDIVFSDGPELFQVSLNIDTVVSPKLEYGKPNQDQEPLLDRALYKYLMEL